MDNDKSILITDNDGTLTRFKWWNFRNSVWIELNKNILNFVRKRLWLHDDEVSKNHETWKNEWTSLSEWYEKLWIPRAEYLYETWKDLDPNQYLQRSYEPALFKLIRSNRFNSHLVTSAPNVWYKKTLNISWVNSSEFSHVVTWEKISSKNEYLSSLIWTFSWVWVVAVGDQEWDIAAAIESKNVGIKIWSSGAERLLQLLHEIDLERFSMVSWWATGSLLYRVKGDVDTVIKIPWFGEKSLNEIMGNSKGYAALNEFWAGVLLPSFLKMGDSHIEMSYLWSDLTHLIIDKKLFILEMVEKIKWKIKNIIMDSPMKIGNSKWADDIVQKIESYKDIFIKLDYISEIEFCLLLDQFAKKCELYGNENTRHHIMPLDFTPDNIFMENGEFKFIDPWGQLSYTWFTTVSLAQFLTLLWIYELLDTDRYELEMLNLNHEFKELFWDYPNNIFSSITDTGAILQCILSAKHRAIKRPEQSKFLFQKALFLMQKFIHA